MAEGKTFQFSLVTPDEVVLDCAARFAAIPAHDGEIGVLAHRAPLVAKLIVGLLRVESAEIKESFLIDGGFAEMVDNRLTILTEDARRPGELDPELVGQGLAAARAMPGGNQVSQAAKEKALQRARLERRVLRRAGG